MITFQSDWSVLITGAKYPDRISVRVKISYTGLNSDVTGSSEYIESDNKPTLRWQPTGFEGEYDFTPNWNTVITLGTATVTQANKNFIVSWSEEDFELNGSKILSYEIWLTDFNFDKKDETSRCIETDSQIIATNTCTFELSYLNTEYMNAGIPD
jgi:hypothetical protein